MARHTTILTGEPINGDTESDNKLAKKVFDVVDGVSAYSIAAAPAGRHIAVVIVWDDA